MKSAILLVALTCIPLISQTAFAAQSCDESRFPKLQKPANEKVYPVQVVKEHRKGIEMPTVDHDGPGFCYVAEKGFTDDIAEAFKLERLGFGRGEAYDSYLVKKGEKHALWIGPVHLPRTEKQCRLLVANDQQITAADLEGATENAYDAARGVYSFREASWTVPAQEREIRLSNKGKDVTVLFTKDLNRFHILCIFPKN